MASIGRNAGYPQEYALVNDTAHRRTLYVREDQIVRELDASSARSNG